MAEPTRLKRRHFFARALAGLTAGAWIGRAAKGDRVEAAPQQDQPYVGEIRMFAGWLEPYGWRFCNGQLLPIADNDALFSLIGTTYGGDGQVTFGLPDLRGRAPIHAGIGPGGMTWTLGETGGSEQLTLGISQIPAHTHASIASTTVGSFLSPGGRFPARNAAGTLHYGTGANTTLAAGALLTTGGSQPHENMQPFLGIHFIISLWGIFPSQT